MNIRSVQVRIAASASSKSTVHSPAFAFAAFPCFFLDPIEEIYNKDPSIRILCIF